MIWSLVFAAATVGALHTAAPDHWMPFAALAKARGWSTWRTARTTILCGFGHVTVSAALAIGALFVGLTVMHAIGSRLEDYATYLLMVFGIVYMIWGLARKHHHHHDNGRVTEWSLFVLFSADPCVAVMPMVMAAADAGWLAVAMVILAYEIATIATMLILVALATKGVNAVNAHWMDHYGHAVAGAFIAFVGLAMLVTGL